MHRIRGAIAFLVGRCIGTRVCSPVAVRRVYVHVAHTRRLASVSYFLGHALHYQRIQNFPRYTENERRFVFQRTKNFALDVSREQLKRLIYVTREFGVNEKGQSRRR